MNKIVEELPACYPDTVIKNFDMKIQFVLDCLSPNVSSVTRNPENVKKEYDAVKDREHQMYDSNTEIDVNCCGSLYTIGFRDYRNYISKLIADRAWPQSGNFLDFGSGNGFNTKILSETFPSAKIQCIDLSESRLQYARQWIGERDNIVYTQMNGAELAFPDNSFDFIYSCHALEQMESVISSAVSEIIRVMKHRAVLIEPVWENADLAQRYYLKRYDYVRSLIAEIGKHKNIRIAEIFPLGVQSVLNQSSLIVLEKKS